MTIAESNAGNGKGAAGHSAMGPDSGTRHEIAGESRACVLHILGGVAMLAAGAVLLILT